MFAAAMLYSCPNLEMSIYSTCKVRVFLLHGVSIQSTGNDDLLCHTAHLPEAAAEHPEVPRAHLLGDRLPEDEGDPHQHGGNRGPGGRVRAGRPDGQLLPE